MFYFIFFSDSIYCCFFVFYPIRSIYIWFSSFKTYFMAFTVQYINTIKDLTTIFPMMFPIWYLHSSDSKRSSINSSALSLIMISLLSLFECITRSSSLPLKEIKLIAIVNWGFHVSDFFMMFFKYGLIILRYSSIDCVLFLPSLLSYSI